MPFVKGNKLAGSRKGIANKTTNEVRTLALSLFDKAYWLQKREQLKAGTLNPKIEALLLSYAYGAPKVEHSGTQGVIVQIGFLGQPQDQQPAIEVHTLDSVKGLTQELTPPSQVALPRDPEAG